MGTGCTSSKLDKVLRYLITNQTQDHQGHTACNRCAHHKNADRLLESDTWLQLEALRRILCERSPTPEIPLRIREDIDAVIGYRNSHALFTSTSSIIPTTTHQLSFSEDKSQLRLSCWKGDITTLTDITAIVNAANSGLLGCFIPEHRCIDNVIHAAAGPRLRDACHEIISLQDHPGPEGLAKVTPGFQLPASHVLHTVGPQLRPRETPQSHHKTQLGSCYHACLDAAESLTSLPDGRKVVAFCCISTGLFAFPSDVAADIAVEAVLGWHLKHPDNSITDVIFNTFLEKDQEIYQRILSTMNKPLDQHPVPFIPPPPRPSPIYTPATAKARTWLEEADALIVSAGAGLSAAAGLDYSSHALFTKRFPAFRAKGLRCLYDVMGYNGWSNPAEKWGYYFLHLDMVRNWPQSPIYKKLRDLVERFPGKHFIRTSNVDGFFVKNGFNEDVIATPQGQYRFLQCFDKCKPDAYALSDPYIDAALPFIDPESQCLTDESKIPKCELCGGNMTLCVRGGRYFNPKPFRDEERKWWSFMGEVEDGVDDGDALSSSPLPHKAVVLELGVGMNTPAVLRWPNEDLVSESKNESYRLIRVGMEASGCVSWELEEQDLAVGISGDIPTALDLIIP